MEAPAGPRDTENTMVARQITPQNIFRVLPRDAIIPWRTPVQRLAADDMPCPRLQTPPPAVFGLSSLGN